MLDFEQYPLVFYKIVQILDTNSLLKIKLVCKSWCQLVNSNKKLLIKMISSTSLMRRNDIGWERLLKSCEIQELHGIIEAHGKLMNLPEYVIDGTEENYYLPHHLCALSGSLKFCQILKDHFDCLLFSSDELSPVNLAAYQGDIEVFTYYAQSLYDVEPFYRRVSALHIAVKYEKYQICEKYLAKFDNKNPKDSSGDTPFHMAVAQNNLKFVALFLEFTEGIENDFGVTPYLMAVKSGNYPICQIFGKYLSNKNPSNSRGDTPLHVAAGFGYEDIFEMIEKNTEDILPINILGMTPFHYAAKKGHYKICEKFLKFLNFPLEDNRGLTPLDLAKHSGHTKIVQLIENYVVSK